MGHFPGETKVRDLQHFVKNAVCRKWSHTPTLTLTQTKCGLRLNFTSNWISIQNIKILHCALGALVAQWVKRWPTDLAVMSSSLP